MPFAAEVAFLALFGIGRDDGQEIAAALDAAEYASLPLIARLERAFIEPRNIAADSLEPGAEVFRRRQIGMAVADEDGSIQGWRRRRRRGAGGFGRYLGWIALAPAAI